MRILWVKPGKLLPLDSGGKLRTYNILRHLSANHHVTFLSYYSGRHDSQYEENVLGELPCTVPVNVAAADTTGIERYLDYLLRLPSSVPYSVSRFTSSHVRRLIADWIAARRFDVAVCDFLASTLSFPRDLPIPVFLFQHNVEGLLWRRRAQFETKWLNRLSAKIEHAKMARFEAQQVRRFHHVFAVSDRDRDAMSGIVNRAHITVIPTGVDVTKFRYEPELRPRTPLVVFAGSMDWAPNIDAVEYFCREVWPHVLAKVPEGRFRIVGRDPHARVRKLVCSSVEVTGTVSCVVDHLREAAVLVVPLRMGGGTRIKIYEGMALGKATVSTWLGAEGLDVRHGHDILLADDPRLFAEFVITLLRDEQTRLKYESAAAATAQKYDWSMVTGQLEAAIRKTVAVSAPG
jgi:polysaccharide biosynthesis protein PslH